MKNKSFHSTVYKLIFYFVHQHVILHHSGFGRSENGAVPRKNVRDSAATLQPVYAVLLYYRERSEHNTILRVRWQGPFGVFFFLYSFAQITPSAAVTMIPTHFYERFARLRRRKRKPRRVIIMLGRYWIPTRLTFGMFRLKIHKTYVKTIRCRGKN